MIRVQPAREPRNFHETVRIPGLRAIAELVGEPGLERRRGRPRQKVADKREQIPSDKFPPYWRGCLEHLMSSYNRICAYTALYIEPVTGFASVDHMVPRSRDWKTVYEWSNYRLACGRMNARKREATDVLDPFEIQTGWFALELVGFQVVPSKTIPPEIRKRVIQTISRLDLNGHDCLETRTAHARFYWNQEITLRQLERDSPFVALELRRQGQLLQSDS